MRQIELELNGEKNYQTLKNLKTRR